MIYEPHQSEHFRTVLGHYPTGVCAVTSLLDGAPVALIVGSFTAVSLAPPLVGFLPMRSSRTWRQIEAAKKFCVNVLNEDQLDLCRTLSSRKEDKFANVAHQQSPAGMPILAGAAAWIDCTLEAVHEAGDHFIVVGHVTSLGAQARGSPLLFWQGGYGRFDELEALDGNCSAMRVSPRPRGV